MNSLSLWRIIVPLVILLLVAIVSWLRPLPRLRIVMLCIGAAVGYGVIQDQFTVRMCVEYFTIAHPPIEGVTNLTLLGLTWGFLGSWWAGLFAGLLAAFASTSGSWPQLTVRNLVRPVLALMLMTGLIAFSVGLSVRRNPEMAGLVIDEYWAIAIPSERHHSFATVALIHTVAYLSAFAGSVHLCLWILLRRWKQSQSIRFERSRKH